MNNYFDNPLLRDLALYITIRENLNILLKTLTNWAQRDKTLLEKVTFMDTKKMAFYYSNPGGTLEKWNNLKPLISLNEELYISKEAKKENALTSVGKSCRPEKITMRVTTYQYEIHICPVKTFSFKA